MLGIAVSTLGRYEQGKRLPDPEVLIELDALGHNVLWLLTGRGLPHVRVQNLQNEAGGQYQSVSAVSAQPSEGLAELATTGRHRLREALEIVEEAIELTGKVLSADKRSELTFAVYDLLDYPIESRAKVVSLLRLMA